MAKKPKIYGVIVIYNPDLDILKNCIYSLKNQLDKLIIVDNTPNTCIALKIFNDLENVEIIFLKDNYGIAYAQNVGIKKALEEKADYILLSDQDTIYPANFIEKMLECFKDEKVAACGPLFLDLNSGDSSFFITKTRLGLKKIYPKCGKHEVFQLIASGTIINAKYLKDIGLMMEDLFIDWVDMEWCWRVVRKGYKIIGNADVIIKHYHGEKNKKLLYKKITLKNPIRTYYTIRNAIYLSLYSKVLSPLERTLLLYKTFRNIFIYSILSENRIKTLKYALKGFYHGLIGRLGKLDE